MGPKNHRYYCIGQSNKYKVYWCEVCGTIVCGDLNKYKVRRPERTRHSCGIGWDWPPTDKLADAIEASK